MFSQLITSFLISNHVLHQYWLTMDQWSANCCCVSLHKAMPHWQECETSTQCSNAWGTIGHLDAAISYSYAVKHNPNSSLFLQQLSFRPLCKQHYLVNSVPCLPLITLTWPSIRIPFSIQNNLTMSNSRNQTKNLWICKIQYYCYIQWYHIRLDLSQQPNK